VDGNVRAAASSTPTLSMLTPANTGKWPFVSEVTAGSLRVLIKTILKQLAI